MSVPINGVILDNEETFVKQYSVDVIYLLETKTVRN